MKWITITASLLSFNIYLYAQKGSQTTKQNELNPVSIIRTSDSTEKIDENVILYNKNLSLFIEELRKRSLKISFKLNPIPGFIKSFLIQLTKDEFSIADAGKDWNCCCDRTDELPNREIICMGIDKNVFFINYLTGGIGEMEHLILIRYENDAVSDFWMGTLSGHLKSKQAIIQYLIENKDIRWALHGAADI